jgi:hypothetical protein
LKSSAVNVHELIAWGLDECPHRCVAIGRGQGDFAKTVESARKRLATRESYVSFPAWLEEETETIKHLLTISARRPDLQEEYKDLDWTLGVVDLRHLLAFQRRLIFSFTQRHLSIPGPDDWPRLISFAFESERNTCHRIISTESTADRLDFSLSSGNPDLQLRLKPKTGDGDRSPLFLYGGSPFLEVAELRGRWFLRDGYHRAYRLLQAGINRVPAVVIYARTIEELGATAPWFFSEEQLFSDHPPQVVDFLEESLVFRYERPALRKMIRVCIEESLQPFDEIDEVLGEKL